MDTQGIMAAWSPTTVNVGMTWLVSKLLLHNLFNSQGHIRAGSQHLTRMGFEPTLVTAC